jgi:hypothetical protein
LLLWPHSSKDGDGAKAMPSGADPTGVSSTTRSAAKSMSDTDDLSVLMMNISLSAGANATPCDLAVTPIGIGATAAANERCQLT